MRPLVVVVPAVALVAEVAVVEVEAPVEVALAAMAGAEAAVVGVENSPIFRPIFLGIYPNLDEPEKHRTKFCHFAQEIVVKHLMYYIAPRLHTC